MRKDTDGLFEKTKEWFFQEFLEKNGNNWPMFQSDKHKPKIGKSRTTFGHLEIPVIRRFRESGNDGFFELPFREKGENHCFKDR